LPTTHGPVFFHQTNGGDKNGLICTKIIRIADRTSWGKETSYPANIHGSPANRSLPIKRVFLLLVAGVSMLIDLNDPELESRLEAQKQLYDRLRATGEIAPARILNLEDTGLRLGQDASLLQFYMEVFPHELPAFNANAQQAVSEDAREKLETGQTIYVKYDPKNPKQVAIYRIPVVEPARVIVCQFCGTAQTLLDEQTACNYCRRPFIL
jgi:hypothetical protein